MFRSGSAGLGFQKGDLRPRPSAMSHCPFKVADPRLMRDLCGEDYALPAAGYAAPPGGTPRAMVGWSAGSKTDRG